MTQHFILSDADADRLLDALGIASQSLAADVEDSEYHKNAEGAAASQAKQDDVDTLVLAVQAGRSNVTIAELRASLEGLVDAGGSLYTKRWIAARDRAKAIWLETIPVEQKDAVLEVTRARSLNITIEHILEVHGTAFFSKPAVLELMRQKSLTRRVDAALAADTDATYTELIEKAEDSGDAELAAALVELESSEHGIVRNGASAEAPRG